MVSQPEDLSDDAFEHRLFVARREIETLARARGLTELHIASLSHRTIVYKALLRAPQLRAFYADLTSPAFQTSFDRSQTSTSKRLGMEACL